MDFFLSSSSFRLIVFHFFLFFVKCLHFFCGRQFRKNSAICRTSRKEKYFIFPSTFFHFIFSFLSTVVIPTPTPFPSHLFLDFSHISFPPPPPLCLLKSKFSSFPSSLRSQKNVFEFNRLINFHFPCSLSSKMRRMTTLRCYNDECKQKSRRFRQRREKRTSSLFWKRRSYERMMTQLIGHPTTSTKSSNSNSYDDTENRNTGNNSSNNINSNNSNSSNNSNNGNNNNNNRTVDGNCNNIGDGFSIHERCHVFDVSSSGRSHFRCNNNNNNNNKSRNRDVGVDLFNENDVFKKREFRPLRIVFWGTHISGCFGVLSPLYYSSLTSSIILEEEKRFDRLTENVENFCYFNENQKDKFLNLNFISSSYSFPFTLRSSSTSSSSSSSDFSSSLPSTAASPSSSVFSTSSYCPFYLVGVITKAPRPSGRGYRNFIPSAVQTFAESHNISVLHSCQQMNDEDDISYLTFVDRLKSLNADVFVTAGYGEWMSREILSIPTFGTFNIHPSLLPRCRGAAPVSRAVEKGDKIVGVSIVETSAADQMNEQYDSGPIVYQEAYSIDPSSSTTSSSYFHHPIFEDYEKEEKMKEEKMKTNRKCFVNSEGRGGGFGEKEEEEERMRKMLLEQKEKEDEMNEWEEEEEEGNGGRGKRRIKFGEKKWEKEEKLKRRRVSGECGGEEVRRQTLKTKTKRIERREEVITADKIMDKLFLMGGKAMIEIIFPKLWRRRNLHRFEQKKEKISLARKVTSTDGFICFEKMSSSEIMNKAKAFGNGQWPGLRGFFVIEEEEEDDEETRKGNEEEKEKERYKRGKKREEENGNTEKDDAEEKGEGKRNEEEEEDRRKEIRREKNRKNGELKREVVELKLIHIVGEEDSKYKTRRNPHLNLPPFILGNTNKKKSSPLDSRDVHFVASEGRIEIFCSDGSRIDVLEIQRPGDRVKTAEEFWRKMKRKRMRWTTRDDEDEGNGKKEEKKKRYEG